MSRIGIASGLGAVMGLLCSRTFGWHLLFSMFIGGIVGGFLCDPLGFYKIVWDVVRGIWIPPLGMICTKARPVLEECWKSAGGALYFLLGIAYFMIPGTLLYIVCGWTGVDISDDRFVIRIIAVCGGFYVIGYISQYVAHCGREEGAWGMPLTRRIPLSFWLTEWNIFKQKNVNGTEKLWWDLTLAERIVIPSLFLLLQLWGIIAAPLLLLDTLLTILILSARSERLAAFTGAVIGAGAGELFRLSGAVPTLEPVLTFGIGFLCGYLSGPLLYRAMKILGRPNETTVVTAY